MKKIWVLLLALVMCLLCSGIALAADTRFDCDCTDIHMHVLPKSGNYGCFAPACGKEHAHDYAEYTCFDLDNPSCGKKSKPHDVNCFTEEALNALTTYNRSFTLQTNKGVLSEPCWPYVYSELSTYQTSLHQYYNTTDDNDLVMQMFLLGNTAGYKAGDTWATQPANIRYLPKSNYEYNWVPAYCCDEAIPVKQYTMYKQVNLEDSSYFDAEASQKIRTVMMNSYPYYTMEEMQARLAAADFEDAELYDESVMIAATQLAVWNFSNGTDEPYDPENYLDRLVYYYSEYRKRPSITAHVPATDDNIRYYIPQDMERVSLLADYLVEKANNNLMVADEDQIIISSAGVTDLAVMPTMELNALSESETDSLQATLRVNFNAPLSARNGEILNVTATSEGGATASAQITSGRTCKIVLDDYHLGDSIDVVAEGLQYVDCGVYFYEPYIENGNIREHSQNLVGISSGLTPVACSVHLEPTSLMLQKVNLAGEALTDAAFSLYFVSPDIPDGKLLINTYSVDELGQVRLSNLLAGATYELQEVKTPEGYEALKRPVRFNVLPGASPVIELVGTNNQAFMKDGVLNITNQVPPPPTGDSSMPVVWAILMVVSILGAALLRKKSVRV